MRTILVALMMLLFAGQAQAHAQLERAEPRVGSIVHAAPKVLRLWFSEGVEPAFSTVALLGAGGRQLATGRPAVDPANRALLVTPILSPLAAGTYRIRWRVVSIDTHVTAGDFIFTVAP